MTVKQRDKLVERRKRHGIALEDMAARLSLNHATLSRWERDPHPERIAPFKWDGYKSALEAEIAERKAARARHHQ